MGEPRTKDARTHSPFLFLSFLAFPTHPAEAYRGSPMGGGCRFGPCVSMSQGNAREALSWAMPARKGELRCTFVNETHRG